MSATLDGKAIVTRCPVHPQRPDINKLCTLCATAIDVNRMNPGWASAGYNPVMSWDGPEAFEWAGYGQP